MFIHLSPSLRYKKAKRLNLFKNGTTIDKAVELIWDPTSNSLLLNFTHNLPDRSITKRSILSIIARVNDPLGLISPVVAKLKTFL